MHHFLIILPHFAFICAFEVIYDYCIYIVKVLYNDALLHTASELCVQ